MVTFIDSVIIVGYAPLMVTVGSYFARRQGTSETFFLHYARTPHWIQ